MIIKRKYELIGILIENDPEAKQIIMNALLSKYDKKEAERILACDYDCFLYPSDISLCIPQFDYVMQKLDELDIIKPYDNGLVYSDVTKVEIIPSDKYNEVELWLLSSKIERSTRIVQILAIRYENGKNKLITPWEVNLLL